ncbi:MAG TPA: hypothetical protein VGB02_19910 [Pyrinomonadaceae bacterium]|jgi:hypothetical protein
MNEKSGKSNTKKQDEANPIEENNKTLKAAESLENSINEPVTKPNEVKEATPPHEEQLKYWKQDLKLKNHSFKLSVLGFVFIIVSILFNTYQIFISNKQLKLNTKQVELNTVQSERLAKSVCYNLHGTVINIILDHDQIFLQKPYLIPYFYKDIEIVETDKYYPEASIAAEYTLDVFDLVADQGISNKECWTDPEAWDAWVINKFSNSPILRKTMDERRDWYGANLIHLYEKALDTNKK